MPRVYFWNAEHLSTQAEVLARSKKAMLERATLSATAQLSHYASKNALVTPAITRSKARSGLGMSKAASSSPYERPIYSNDSKVQRQIEREVRSANEVERLQYKVRVSRRKVETQDWLEAQPYPVFYCEVQQDFPAIPHRCATRSLPVRPPCVIGPTFRAESSSPQAFPPLARASQGRRVARIWC